MNAYRPMLLAVALLACLSVAAAETNAPPAGKNSAAKPDDKKGHTGTKQSKYLYTKPDPTAAGGIRFRIATPKQQPLGVYALQQRELKFCYQAEIGKDGEITFTGLPSAKYDLLVLFPNCYYEGLTLSREKSTLTEAHCKAVDKAIQRSTPFFNLKRLDRCEGFAGEDGEAYAMEQDMRTEFVTLQSGETRNNIQIRSLKLAWFADMGDPGWHLRGTREIKRQEVLIGPEFSGLLPHYYATALQGIRVTDTVKDLGKLNLEKK